MNVTKWMLGCALVTSLFAAEGCRRRNRDDDNSGNNNANTAPTNSAPAVQQPGMQQPGMQQPGGGDYIQAQMQMRQQQFAQGMNAVLPLSRGTLAEHGTQSYAVQMTPGQCYKIIGVGGSGVIDLDLKLYDPNNQEIDQDVATDNYPVIGLRQDHPLCPQTAGQYRLEVIMYQGAGDFGVQVFGR